MAITTQLTQPNPTPVVSMVPSQNLYVWTGLLTIPLDRHILQLVAQIHL